MDLLRTTAALLARRPAWAAVSLYAILALVFVGQSWLPDRTLSTADQLWLTPPWTASKPAGFVEPANPATIDHPLAFRPWLSYARAELPHAPLWNPYVMAGRPFIGNGQSAVFSPFSVPAFVLPFGFAMGFAAWLKLVVAAFGTFLLARALRIGWPGAFVAGLVYSFGLPFVAWLLVAAPSNAWAVIPWLLLACERLVARPRPPECAALALAVALILVAGQPESSFHALAAASLFYAFRLVRSRSGSGSVPRDWLAPIAGFAVAIVWGVAIAAIAVLPFVELLSHSTETAERGRAVHAALERQYFAGLALPDYWGRGSGVVGFRPQNRFLYVGALPIVLALVALLRPSIGRIAGASAAAACLLVVFGVSPAFDAVNALPGFGHVQNTRLTILFVLCVALLAGAGLEDLRLGRLTGGRTWAPPAIAAVVVCIPLAWLATRWPSTSNVRGAAAVAWKFATPPDDLNVVRLSSLLLWLTFAGGGLVLLLLWRQRVLAPGLLAAAAAVLVCLDLFRAGMGFNPAIPDANAQQPATGAIRYLQSRRPARFAGVGSVVPPNTAMSFGLLDARGYDFPVERRYARLWESVNPFLVFARGASVPYKIDTLAPTAMPALNLLGVADIVVGPGVPKPPVPGLRVVYQGPDATVYANARALPRAFVFGGQRVVADEEAALRAVVRPRFDARRSVVVERPLRALGRGPTAPAGSARVVEANPERVEVQATATRPGMLVLSDVYYPGWQATVDGRPRKIERVNYLLRGVAVGRGRHHVSFVYRPATFRIGVAISLVALLGLAAVGLNSVRRRREPSAYS